MLDATSGDFSEPVSSQPWNTPGKLGLLLSFYWWGDGGWRREVACLACSASGRQSEGQAQALSSVCFIGLREVLRTLWCSVLPDFPYLVCPPASFCRLSLMRLRPCFVRRVCLGALRTPTFPVTPSWRPARSVRLWFILITSLSHLDCLSCRLKTWPRDPFRA